MKHPNKHDMLTVSHTCAGSASQTGTLSSNGVPPLRLDYQASVYELGSYIGIQLLTSIE